MLELVFRPDRRSGEPAYRQLERTLREWIAAGRIVPGERLPASRELAAQLSLARNTVNRAYQGLADEGVLTAHVGQGTFVAARPRRVAGGEPAGGPARVPGFAWDSLMAARARGPELPALVAPRDPRELRFDFLGGRVAPEALPRAALRRAFARALAELPRLANQIDPMGFGPLREEIARALVARGIACEAGDVVVTNGAQQALDLVARALVEPGDAVGLEQPGYFGARLAFAQARLVPLRVDGEGLRVDELARVLRARRLRLVYVTPSAQVPTGAVLSEARREALLDLADRTQTPVLEDDYDSELRFEGPPLPALKTRDPAGRVVYVGTFSKALWPGLRVGYAVAARPLARGLARIRFAADLATDVVAQAVVAELLHTGALERHVRRVRRIQAERRAALLAALEACMPAGATWTRPAGGNLVWLTLPPDVDPLALAAGAARAGLAYAPGESFTLGDEGRGSLALGFASMPPARLREGVALLAELVEGARARRMAG